jgi:hypothetical protein
MPIESDSSSEENDTPTTKYSSRSKQQNTTSDKSTTDEINSRRTSIVSRTTENTMTRYKKVNNFKKIHQRRRIIPEKLPTKSSFSESEKLEFQLKFAEQMQKNQDEFQQFCKDHEHSSQSSGKREVRAYPTAIFGPSPFSDIKIEPLKTLPRHNQTDLPLKFPWNGVFNTQTSSITWKNPSILFFFEATLPEQH